ncbi:hypothetical protein [Haloactinomyces albus]|uniref:Uncharacterized protein n=1 Tax=Haloactinomyces albus TaxID=1352928 RepID=A0AAE4CKB1_9ACTN|nr:hypothetical protein [Haloactinomyces albus]MDR7300970.1 hypothetical protein [Haloactinomyces albus]
MSPSSPQQPSPQPSERSERASRRYRPWPVLSLCVSLTMVIGLLAVAAPASAQTRAAEEDSDGLVSGLVDLLLPSDDGPGKPRDSPLPSSPPPEGTDPITAPDTTVPGTTTPSVPVPSTTPSPSVRPSSPSPSVPPPGRPKTSAPEPSPSAQPEATETGAALPTASPGTPGDAETKPGPGRQWTLTASKLTLIGSRYHGHSMREVDGRQVKTLHFTAQRLEITDLVQRGALGNGTIMRTASAPGRVSTVTDGPVHLYTRRLTGTLDVADYPLVPVTLSPDSLAAPNLDLSFLRLPTLTFTDAVVHNVELSGGRLFIPDAHISLE